MQPFFFDHRWYPNLGIGRFAKEVGKRLHEVTNIPLNGRPVHPLDCFRVSKILRTQQARGFFSPGFNLPLRSSCPSICTVHDLIHIHFPQEQSLAKTAYYHLVQRPAVRRSPLVLTVSEFSRSQIIDWYGIDPAKVICVGNGVSDAFSPGGTRYSGDRPYLLYVGNDKAHKNIGTIFSALKRITEKETTDLIMVTQPSPETRRQAREYGVESRVHFKIGPTDQELATLYRGAVATVLPSFFEGFGLSLVEAMASGCPVIAANATSMPEVVADAGLLFDPNKSDELVLQFLRILDSPTLRADLSRRGIVQAKRFNWDMVGDRVRLALEPFLKL